MSIWHGLLNYLSVVDKHRRAREITENNNTIYMYINRILYLYSYINIYIYIYIYI